jgi:hypothetical protein
VSRNFLLAASVEEPVARIFNFGKPSAPIFRTRAGSRSWCTSSNTTTGLEQPREKKPRVADHVLDGGKIAVDVEDALRAKALSQLRTSVHCRETPAN